MSGEEMVQRAAELHQAGRLDDAELLYRQALTLKRNDLTALHKLGMLLMRRGETGEGVGLLQQAVELAPHSPELQYVLGKALCVSGQLAEAEAAMRRSIAIQPGSAQAHNILGVILVRQERHEEAIAAWRKSVELKPDYAEAYVNLGAALAQLKRTAEAKVALERGVELNPSYAPAHNNLANVLDELEQLDRAIVHWERALELASDYFDAQVNLGKAMQRLGQRERALKLFDHAIALRPNDPDARFLRGLTLLMMGRLTEGFADYSYRIHCKELKIDPRKFAEPQWDGRPRPDKTILVKAEQGFGDTIQFIRYAPMVRQRCKHVMFECQAELADLMRKVEGVDVVAVRNQGLPPFDLHVALLDLPRVLGTTLETIPANVPYLSADATLVSEWQDRLSAAPPGRRVGLAWTGNPSHSNDRNRSIPLRMFQPLAEVGDVTFISLQKDFGVDQLADRALKIRPIDYSSHLKDFSQTAALMANLDLIITVDTGIAHLAGALGRPVWVLLPFTPDWRWLLDRSDSPWYPTARLFRQPKSGDWGSVIQSVVSALGKNAPP